MLRSSASSGDKERLAYALSEEHLRELIQKRFPHSVDVEELEEVFAPEFKSSEPYKWCVNRLGPCAFELITDRGTYWQLDKKATWDFMGNKFYFQSDKDATLFKVFFYA